MIVFRTLGAVDLRKGNAELSTLLAQPKRLALLAWLATARPRGVHGRETLLALFWPGSDAERARNSLRQALHHLRRTLGEDAVVTRGEGLIGVSSTVVRCDAALFDDAIDAGRWEEALSLHRGEFLPGVLVQEAPQVQGWIATERARRRRAAADAAWRLAEAARDAADAGAVERFGRQAVALDGEAPEALARLDALLTGTGAAGIVAEAPVAHGEFAGRVSPAAGTRDGAALEGFAGQSGDVPPAAPPGELPGGGAPPRPLRGALLVAAFVLALAVVVWLVLTRGA